MIRNRPRIQKDSRRPAGLLAAFPRVRRRGYPPRPHSGHEPTAFLEKNIVVADILSSFQRTGSGGAIREIS